MSSDGTYSLSKRYHSGILSAFTSVKFRTDSSDEIIAIMGGNTYRYKLLIINISDGSVVKAYVGSKSEDLTVPHRGFLEYNNFIYLVM